MISRRGFLWTVGAAAGALVIPYEPKRAYQFFFGSDLVRARLCNMAQLTFNYELAVPNWEAEIDDKLRREIELHAKAAGGYLIGDMKITKSWLSQYQDPLNPNRIVSAGSYAMIERRYVRSWPPDA